MRYEVKGETLPVVVCYLEDGEQMITERGSMSWMSPNMRMETSTNGGLGKAFGRMFAGEAMFQNIYTAQHGQGMIAFASSFPGRIVPFEIGPGRELVVQKSGFLASEIGMDCSHTCPGPVITVLNSPSPPNSTFFTPETLWISILQVASMAAR